MKVSKIALFFSSILVVGCTNNNVSPEYVAGKYTDPYKIMEEKREYYKEVEEKEAQEKMMEEKAQLEEVTENIKEEVTVDGKVVEEANATEVIVPEEVQKEAEEKEKIKNMTPNERLLYKVDKAKEKIDAMAEIAKNARQEEIDNAEAIKNIQEALKKDSAE